MPTKKEPSAQENEIAEKKRHPVSKASRVSIAQNGESGPKSKKAEEVE